jgi:hypothetical protein
MTYLGGAAEPRGVDRVSVVPPVPATDFVDGAVPARVFTDTSGVTLEVSSNDAVGSRPTVDEVRPTGEPARSSPVLLAAPVLVMALLMAVVLRYSALDLDNQDTWFHLALGDRFLDGWSLAHPGALSSFATSSWVPTQWSTEVVASEVQHRFGLPGVAFLFGALMLVFLLAVYALCRRFGSAPVAALLTAFVVFASAPALSARPQIVSLILLAVTVGAWLRTAEDLRVRWWLVPLTWVWATAHGLWSAGVLLGVVFCVGLVLDRRVDRRRGALLFAVPVLSVVAAALTPVGPRLLASQLAVSDRTSMIREWGPTSFREVPALAAAALVAWLIVLWARRGHVSWTHLLLMLLGSAWILLVTRMVAPGAVVVAPLVAAAMREVSRPAPAAPVEPPVEPPVVPRVERWGVGLAAVAYVLGLALALPHTARVAEGVPTGFSSRLGALPAGSVVLVEDGVGGWLEWRFPRVDPVVDGLLDAYPVDYLRGFFDMTALEPGWPGFVRHSGADVAVLRRGSALTAAMRQQLGWHQVQRDRDWVYLVPPTGP